MGINCEMCIDGYYRPAEVDPRHPDSCRMCLCDGPGATGMCVKDDSMLIEGIVSHNAPCYHHNVCLHLAYTFFSASWWLLLPRGILRAEMWPVLSWIS